MQLKTKSFRKPADGVVSGKIFWNAQNLFMSDEENWKRFRTLLTPAFSDHSLSDIFNDHIMPQMNELYDHINREKNVNITKMFQLFTFDIIAKAGFGYDSKALRTSDYTHLNENEVIMRDGTFIRIIPLMFRKYAPFLPVKPIKNFFKNLFAWQKFISDIIISKDPNEKGTDLLSRMMDAVEDGDRMNHDELKVNSHIFLIAGHETTSYTLINLFYFLSYYPEVYKKVQEEVDSFKPKKGEWDEYREHFKYTRCVMWETLRLKTPAHAMLRETDKEINILGYTIPPNAFIMTMDWLTCKDPEFWGKDAEEFKPERFLDKDVKKMNFFPFSIGPRTCIGRVMAEMEIIGVVANVMKKFDFKMDPSHRKDYDELKVEFTRKPKFEMFADFVPRKNQ